MSTAVAEKDEEQAALAQLREDRFQKRLARLQEQLDLGIIDQRLFELLTDRTIWDTPAVCENTGISQTRLSIMRGKTRELGHDDHPGAFPLPDTVAHIRWGVPDYGTEAGRVREWLLQSGRYFWDPEAGQLVKSPTFRHGRPRTKAR